MENNNIEQKIEETKIQKPFPSWGDLFAFLGIFLLCSLIGGLVVTPLMHLSGSVPQQIVTLVSYSVQFALMIAILLIYRKSRGGKGRLFRFSFKWFNAALIVWGVVLVFMIGVVIEPLLGLFPDSYLEMLNNAVGRGGWAVLTTVVLAPIMEETVFRGFILESVRSRFGSFRAILISAAIFGLIHIIPQQVINAFFVGIVLGFIYVKTQSLTSVIILHAINNAIAYIQTILFDGKDICLRSLISNDTLYYVLYGISAAVCILALIQIVRYAKTSKDAAMSTTNGNGQMQTGNNTTGNNVDNQ